MKIWQRILWDFEWGVIFYALLHFASYFAVTNLGAEWLR